MFSLLFCFEISNLLTKKNSKFIEIDLIADDFSDRLLLNCSQSSSHQGKSKVFLISESKIHHARFFLIKIFSEKSAEKFHIVSEKIFATEMLLKKTVGDDHWRTRDGFK